MTTLSEPGNRIEDYALIGDLQTAALVGRDGSIDWLCLPHFDSAACFAALLDTDDAGSWRLAPAGATTVHHRRYVDETLVLVSSWDTDTGSVDVVDFMPPRGETADIVRIVRGTKGRVPMQMSLRLRFDYGRMRPWTRLDGQVATAVSGPDAVQVWSSVGLEQQDGAIAAEFVVTEGQTETFVLDYHESHLAAGDATVRPEDALHETVDFWTSWLGQCRYDGPWATEVRRALILLKALTFAPTGGILAAATTSLPEEIGGVRNWDYRFCWLRDATFTLQALLGTGFVDEARAWREWLVRAVAGDPSKLQIMYGLDGRPRLPEHTLDWLAGFEGSAPVRVGNAAVGQRQLDVWGEVLDGLHLAREAGIEISDPAWDLQCALLDWLEGHWQEPDSSLWEMRGPTRQFVHSKVMAWAGLDRAVHTVEEHGLDGPIDRWRALRDTIHREVCEQGFDTRRGCFTQSYGSGTVDAALLLLPRVGFVPWDDPRMTGTIEVIQDDLCVDGFLLRYDTGVNGRVDGIPGGEGAFLPCSFWLADALHGVGRHAEARELFERLLALRNDVGLLSEEYDPHAKRQLGNTPQAFSMVGLVNTARSLGGAEIATSASRRKQDVDAH